MNELPLDDSDAVQEKVDDLKQRHTANAKDAREQASEGQFSFLRSEFRTAADGEVFEIPHKDLFDNDQQERWDALQDAVQNDYDREPDVTNTDGEVVVRGRVKYPHRLNGQRLAPWSERLAQVIWGEDGAKRAKAGGIMLNEIEIVWLKQQHEMNRRLSADPKSD